MRILLLDDSPRHRRAGIQQLEAAGHEVVALFDYTEAVQQARDEDFDVALIDLLMPAEPTTLGPDAMAEHVGREIGVGFPMALIFAQAGIPLIAVATDSNHHAHPDHGLAAWRSSQGRERSWMGFDGRVHARTHDGRWCEELHRDPPATDGLATPSTRGPPPKVRLFFLVRG